MPTESADARMLLRQPPDDYVTERARLVKQARSEGDREQAKFLQSLKRPNLALWAVLVAGGDADAVGALMTATTELATVQGGGARAGAVSTATQFRRKALEAMVDRAVKALAQSLASAESRRAEIRDVIDQLSRHPELADSWIDGTLRDLPADEFGFGAFTGMPDVPTPKAEAPAHAPARRPKAPREAPVARPATPPADDRAARAARTRQTTQARKDISAAVRELTAAERRVAVARTAFDEAETELRQAEQKHDAAEQKHRDAIARLQ